MQPRRRERSWKVAWRVLPFSSGASQMPLALTGRRDAHFAKVAPPGDLHATELVARARFRSCEPEERVPAVGRDREPYTVLASSGAADRLDLIEPQAAASLTPAGLAVAPDPQEGLSAVPARALVAAPYDRARVRDLALLDVVERLYLRQQHALRLDDVTRRHAELRHRGALEADVLHAAWLVHRQEWNPVLGNGRAEHVADRRGGRADRRRLDTGPVGCVVAVDADAGRGRNAILDPPDHVRHLVADVADLLERLALE